MKNIMTLLLLIVFLISCGSDGDSQTIGILSVSNDTRVLERDESITIIFDRGFEGSYSFEGDLGPQVNATLSTTNEKNDTLTLSPKTNWKGGEDQNLVANINSSTGTKRVITLSGFQVPLTFNLGARPTVVIGQNDLTTTSNGTSSTKMESPWNVFYSGDKFYISDYGNSRVLGYNSIPSTDGAAADFVLGQTDLDSNTAATSQTGLNNILGIDGNSSQFAIADYGNNRVLIYSGFPSSTPGSPTVVLGQLDFNSNASACNPSSLNSPYDIELLDDKLIVADTANNRVLIWNSIPTTNNQAADIVIGQTDFDHCAENDNNGDGSSDGPGIGTLNGPSSVWSDGTKLIVLDDSNNRVMIWSAFPTSNSQVADTVLGQADFSQNTPNKGAGPTASSLSPSENILDSNSRQLCVSDYVNNRVLIWDNIKELESNQDADFVLGQDDFTSDADIPQDNARAVSCAFVNNKVIVGDSGNHRVLIYESE